MPCTVVLINVLSIVLHHFLLPYTILNYLRLLILYKLLFFRLLNTRGMGTVLSAVTYSRVCHVRIKRNLFAFVYCVFILCIKHDKHQIKSIILVIDRGPGLIASVRQWVVE